jgi:hypothetical protein
LHSVIIVLTYAKRTGNRLLDANDVTGVIVGILFAKSIITVIKIVEIMTEQKKILKRAWQKPELKILCRGESEENVLASCKNHVSFMQGGPLGWDCKSLGGLICNVNTNS